MDSKLFERCFVAVACEYGAKQYGSVMAYAKKIWPDKEDKNAAPAGFFLCSLKNFFWARQRNSFKSS